MAIVLVLDDSASALEFATMALEESGHEVDTAINVAELVGCIDRRKPDLVLVDVMMPELAGYDLVRYLRDVKDVKAPVVLFSSLDDHELAEYARRSGASGFIQKDPEPAALVAAVKKFLDQPRPR